MSKAIRITTIHVIEDIDTGLLFVRVYRSNGETSDLDLLYGNPRGDLDDFFQCDALRTVLASLPGETISPDYTFSRECM